MKPSPLGHVARLPRSLWWTCLFALVAATADAQPKNIRLPAPAQGSAAIGALGAHLPEVAKAYGLQAQELVTLLQTQPSLGVDLEGALLFACEGLAVPGHTNRGRSSAGSTADALTADSSITAIASGISVDAFKLHSLPGCPRVIYLDFTGHTTSGTSWNSSYGGGAPIVSQPFNLDTDPLTFNATERSVIQKIWQRVAEDYAPFNVDVTTEDPGVEGVRRSDSGDLAYGIRVVISPTNWYKSTAGGVAYISSFTSSTDTPCFAFTAQLGTSSDKYIGECVSHEAGHTLGLYHDGLGGASPTEYYQGQGTWAPIMGNSYYKAVTQFSKGEYANANRTQDDVAVVATFIPVIDDHGNTLAGASILSGPSVADGGTIETRGDVDVFRFDTGAGNISLTLTSPAPAPNLDLKAELLNSSGQVLQTSDSLTALGASLSATVAGGTYYLRVDGVGNGDPVTTGYSDYASIGNYLVSGTIVSAGTKLAPVAAITATPISGTVPLTVDFSGQASKDSDGVVASYQWAFGNGDTATGVSTSYTYTTAGKYSAVLTVVDNEGLVGTAVVEITVGAAANVPPTAAASANITTGTAPVQISFSSVGSKDSDGQIVSYKWEFGDGTSSLVASPTKTYSTPGSYTARLTVTDDRGATATATVAISVVGDPNTDVDVHGFSIAITSAKSGITATATITVLDRLSRPVSGATVTLQWTGVVSANSSGTTDAAGKVLLVSPRSKRGGTATATITAVIPPTGRRYDPSISLTPLVLTTVLK
jgi:PKD repeat protein